MVRSKPDDDSNNAFSIDDDEDMDTLLEEAANAGSAAVSELETQPNESFGFEAEVPVTSTVKEPGRQEVVEKAPIEATVELSAESKEIDDEIDALLETIENERTASTPPVRVAEPTPIQVTQETPAAVASPPKREPLAPAAEAPKPKRVAPNEDQVRLAQRVIATVDVYRNLSAEAQDVVSQLLTPANESITQDEGTVAIRAIYAEAIQESTQRALIEAKASTPVDRVFYVLGLPKDVLHHLGELVQAYTQKEIAHPTGELAFARALVDDIESLTDEPIVYAEAMAKVLEAAQK